jgi:transcription elongation factor GreA
MVTGLDESMAQAIRRLLERGDGLGPTVQDEMMRILRGRFGALFAKPKVALWEDESILVYTPRGLKAKEEELAEIVNVKMRDNARAIGEAAAHGDLSENSEYKFALEERDFLRARVAKLNREISMARVLEPADIPADFIAIGQRIRLEPVTSGASMDITILGYDESDLPNRVYSYHSPFARQLIGKKTGDVVRLTIEDLTNDYLILSFTSALA